MLTGSKILEELRNGNIGITPFDIKNLNPNSYNVTLSNKLKVYKNPDFLYVDRENPTEDIIIPEEGLLLKPGVLYIGATKEIISSNEYISAIDGRSSIGRLGINIHATAGFGDVGFSGTYTLEIFVVQPVLIKPNILIGQVSFTKPTGDIDFLYKGRYNNQVDPTASRLHMTEEQLDKEYHYKSN